MKFADSVAFRDNWSRFKVTLINGDDRFFSIALNFRTGLYYKTMAFLADAEGMDEKIATVALAEIVAELLSAGYDQYSIDWVMDNLAPDTQTAIINEVFKMVLELLSNDSLNVPEVNVKKDPPSGKNKAAKEQAAKKRKIKNLNKILSGKIDAYLMDEIALVMMKTNNGMQEIMDMPILFFKDLYRNIVVSEMRSDDDYNIAYLNKIGEQYLNGLKERVADRKPDTPKKDMGAMLEAVFLKQSN